MSQRVKLFCLFTLLVVSCTRQGVPSKESTAVILTPSPNVNTKTGQEKTPSGYSPTRITLKVPDKTPTFLSPTSTIEPTLIATPTFLATFSPEIAEAQVLKLLKNNAQCDLPCWWGLKPGETSYEAANRLLSPLSINPPYTPGDITQQAWVYYSLPAPKTPSVLKTFDLDTLFEYSKLKYIRIGSLHWENYTLANFLKVYGPPEELLVHTYQWVPGGQPPFALFLFYPKKGILAYFASSNEKQEVKVVGDSIQGCFSQSATDLYLWSINEPLTLNSVAEEMNVGILNQEEKLKLPIDKATGMNIQKFYQTYKEVKTTPCIQTPKNLWPSP